VNADHFDQARIKRAIDLSYSFSASGGKKHPGISFFLRWCATHSQHMPLREQAIYVQPHRSRFFSRWVQSILSTVPVDAGPVLRPYQIPRSAFGLVSVIAVNVVSLMPSSRISFMIRTRERSG